MEYLVKRIKSREEITFCRRFEVSHFQWVNGPEPETYGYMGYVEGEGLYVEMCCKEANPKRVCVDPEGRFVSDKGGRGGEGGVLDGTCTVSGGISEGDRRSGSVKAGR